MSATMMTTFPSMAMVAGGALIASPSSVCREQVMDRLNGRCRPVQQALGGADALAKLEKGDWQLLFLDRRVSDLDTEELTAIIRKRFPGIQVVLLDSDAGFCGDAPVAKIPEVRIKMKARSEGEEKSSAILAPGMAPLALAQGAWSRT